MLAVHGVQDRKRHIQARQLPAEIFTAIGILGKTDDEGVNRVFGTHKSEGDIYWPEL